MNISVIIPTYNRLHQIGRAIRSVLNQSYPAQEILVVDDGSTDATCARIEVDFPEVKLIRQTNQGVSAARNAGIAASCGDWIAFLDSDDEWRPDKLAKQVDTLAQHAQIRICHTDEIWIRNGVRVNPCNKHRKPSGWIFENCLPLCCVSPSSILISRSVFSEIGNFDQTLPVCEDYDLWLRIFSRYPICLVNDRLVIKYGGHADQLSRKFWGMDRFRVRAIAALLESGQLNDIQETQAKATLSEKLSVLINGFKKRDKHDDARHYQEMMMRFNGQ